MTNVNTVDIRNADYIDFDDPDYMRLLRECLVNAQQYNNVSNCFIVLSPRVVQGREYSPVGWLEFGMSITFDDRTKLYVGCLQRCKGALNEFHT
jgi:hypothetical protein